MCICGVYVFTRETLGIDYDRLYVVCMCVCVYVMCMCLPEMSKASAASITSDTRCLLLFEGNEEKEDDVIVILFNN